MTFTAPIGRLDSTSWFFRGNPKSYRVWITFLITSGKTGSNERSQDGYSFKGDEQIGQRL